MIRDIEDFRALDPFFRIIEQGLQGLVDGDHFFNLLADDVVVDFVITVPDYPRHIVGRGNLIVHQSDSTSSVVLEYAGHAREKLLRRATHTATDTSP